VYPHRQATAGGSPMQLLIPAAELERER